MKDKQNILKRRDNEGLTASNGSERSAWFSLDMIPVLEIYKHKQIIGLACNSWTGH